MSLTTEQQKIIHAVLDGGHSDVKFIADGTLKEFPHILATIDEREYERIKRQSGRRMVPEVFRMKLSDDHGFNLEGYFAVGQMARDYAQSTRLRELRYQPDYIGVLFAGALSHAFKQQPHTSKMRLTALYPVEDDHSAENLENSLYGKWEVECANGPKLKFNVKASTFPEGLAGLMAKVINQHGNERQGWAESSILVIDIGGNTVNVIGYEAPWQMVSHKSFNLGVNQALHDFILSVREEFPALVSTVSHVNRVAMREALREERWMRRGDYDLRNIAGAAKDRLMHRFIKEMENFNFADYEKVVFVGGGSGLLWNRLLTEIVHLPDDLMQDQQKALVAAERQEVHYAVDDLNSIQFANVLGMRKAQVAQILNRSR